MLALVPYFFPQKSLFLIYLMQMEDEENLVQMNVIILFKPCLNGTRLRPRFRASIFNKQHKPIIIF